MNEKTLDLIYFIVGILFVGGLIYGGIYLQNNKELLVSDDNDKQAQNIEQDGYEDPYQTLEDEGIYENPEENMNEIEDEDFEETLESNLINRVEGNLVCYATTNEETYTLEAAEGLTYEGEELKKYHSYMQFTYTTSEIYEQAKTSKEAESSSYEGKEGVSGSTSYDDLGFSIIQNYIYDMDAFDNSDGNIVVKNKEEKIADTEATGESTGWQCVEK